LRIVLGSQSPRRADILRAALPGHFVEVLPADIDEKAIRHEHPSAMTLAIARAKCEAVRRRVRGDAVIVTADTVARCNGEIREKPESAEELERFVRSYGTYPVMAITSVYAMRTRTGWTGSVTDTAVTKFRPFSDERIAAIVTTDAFYGSAGGFLIEHPLMRDHLIGLDGDPDTVQGLPGRLVKLLVQDALESK